MKFVASVLKRHENKTPAVRRAGLHLGALLAAMLVAGSAAAQVSLTEQLQGWVNDKGGSNEALPRNNTFTGSENGMRFNSWAAFFIPAGGNYTGATLSLAPSSYGAIPPSVIGLYEVSTPFSSLDNTFHPGTDVFKDLGDGRQYGSATMSNSSLSITLNGRALADINASGGKMFVIGFTNETLNALPAMGFGEGQGIYVGGTPNRPREVMTLNLVSAVPEPASWASMTLGLGVLGVALRRRSRKPTHAA
jgi:hypothetical protein